MSAILAASSSPTPAAPRMHWRKCAAAITLALSMMWATFCGATPAHGHGGPMVIFPSIDGSGRVIAVLVYERDAHFVDLENGLDVEVEVEAVAPDGTTWGPLTMTPSQTSPGSWESPELIGEGTWTVTISLLKPESKKASFEVVDGEVPLAPPAEDPIADSELDASVEAVPSPEASSASASPVWVLPLAGVAFIALVVALVVVRAKKRGQ